MKERETRQFLQNLEGTEQDPAVFDVEMLAWNHAVLVSDYLRMFRSGSKLATTIYGDPYDSHTRVLTDSEYSDNLAALHSHLISCGVEAVQISKPDPNQLHPSPAAENTDPSQPFGTANFQDDMRFRYQQKFLERMYGWGYRDILASGVAGYLDQVPDQLDLLTFCAPYGTKSFVSQEGFVAMGLDTEPDYDRPLSQRGGYAEFLTSQYSHLFETVTSQLGFLVDHLDRFEFRADDLLGYRPRDMTHEGIAVAWEGWQRAS